MEMSHSFHPPVYHTIAAAWVALLSPQWDGNSIEGLKTIQLLSVLFSMINLLLIIYGIRSLNWISKGVGRTLAIGVASLHPVFMIWSGFISNDGLSYLMGTLILITLHHYLLKPSFRTMLISATVLGIGLSTKLSLLCFFPAIHLALWGSQPGKELSKWGKLFAVGLVLILASPKLIINYQEGLNPLFHNMDLKPLDVLYQRESFTDPIYCYSFDFFRLWREPYFKEMPPYSVATLLFGSFWNDYYLNQTNFTLLKDHSFWIFPRLEMLGGFFMTIFILRALLLEGIIAIKMLLQRSLLSRERSWFLGMILSVGTLLLMVIFLGLRYEAWSCLQGRLLFPVFAILILFLGRAEERLRKRPVMNLVYTGLVGGFILNSLLMILLEISVFYRSVIP